MSKLLHTQECLEYAAKTRKSFCIASCADERRKTLLQQTKDFEKLYAAALREFEKKHDYAWESGEISKEDLKGMFYDWAAVMRAFEVLKGNAKRMGRVLATEGPRKVVPFRRNRG